MAEYDTEKEFDVIVIGAGSAGLSAAKELIASGASVVVLEATAKVGGRVQNDEGALDPRWAIELGPEFIHGEANNPILDLVHMGLKGKPEAKLVELEWPNYYYFGKEGTLVVASEADENDADVAKMLETFEGIGELCGGDDRGACAQAKEGERGEGEQSLLQHFASHGVQSRVLDLADAIFANDYGAEMSKIGMKECIEEQKRWIFGEKYLVLENANFQDVMDTLADSVMPFVRLNSPAHTVRLVPGVIRGVGKQSSTPPTTVEVVVAGQRSSSSAGERRVRGRRVIVTVPLSVLQLQPPSLALSPRTNHPTAASAQKREEEEEEGSNCAGGRGFGGIRFEPPLPRAQAQAIDTLEMGNALKCVVRLRSRCWPLDFFDAVCADCFFPEVWLSPAAQLMRPECAGPFTVVGFVAGKRAERVGKLDPAEVARLLLNQLDAMFGTLADPHPASDSCQGFPHDPSSFLVKNWKDAPFAHGAYSYPTLGAQGLRAAAFGDGGDGEKDKDHGNGHIFFAGEHTGAGVNACVHGAMLTGTAAAKRVFATLENKEEEEEEEEEKARGGANRTAPLKPTSRL